MFHAVTLVQIPSPPVSYLVAYCDCFPRFPSNNLLMNTPPRFFPVILSRAYLFERLFIVVAYVMDPRFLRASVASFFHMYTRVDMLYAGGPNT